MATRPIVPRVDGEGTIGTTLKKWGNGAFKALVLATGAIINKFSIDGTLVSNSDAEVPTVKAVKTYVDTEISDLVIGPATNHNNYVPQWNGANARTLKDGLSVVTTIGETGSDSSVPTEQAVREALASVTVASPSFTTSEAVTAYRVIAVISDLAVHADALQSARVKAVVGIAKNSAAQSELVEVQNTGIMTNQGWMFQANEEVYLASDGTMSQAVSDEWHIVSIGTAVSEHSIFIQIGKPIFIE